MPKTPEICTPLEPVTPGRDPAAIDRRGLVGVGELATPRWARGPRRDQVEIDEPLDEVEEEPSHLEEDEVLVDEPDQDLPDSPWTIEAIDGEPEDKDEVSASHSSAVVKAHYSSQFVEIQPISRPLRSRRSVADESGGEEILYPRHPVSVDDRRRVEDYSMHLEDHRGLHDGDILSEIEPTLVISSADADCPPSAFTAPTNRPRKRTSDEFEMDHAGVLVAKSSTAAKEKEKVRRHKSLSAAPASVVLVKEKAKERRRDTMTINVKHQRQTSASSSSSSHGDTHPSRRVHASDFSHLPPSPSSSSIKQFLKQGGTGSKATSPSHHSLKERDSSSHLPTNVVAHSLLRGTQEGWSDLDDQATMEALRKLDGLTGRSARARSSIGAQSRLGSSSRPGTPPAGASGQWEGIEGGRGGKRMSIAAKDKERVKGELGASQRNAGGLGITATDPAGDGEVHTPHSGEEQHSSSPAPEKYTLKKSNSITRTSFTGKRGSASSGTYTSTPTTSSRDSATLSISTNATSVSATSGRQSTNKTKRNSASSDLSGYTGEATFIRDRAASLAGAVDSSEEQRVPPVPPLPKDISHYKQPPQTPTMVASQALEPPTSSRSKRETVSDMRFQSSLEVPSFPSTPSKHASLQVQKSATTPTSIQKTPSKKWSFSNVMGKKLSSSPSISSMNESQKSPGLPISPRSLTFGAQLRKSVSKERTRLPNTKASAEDWSPINSAMASATSLASVSSMGSVRCSVRDPLSPSVLGATLQAPSITSQTPDRSETASSASTNVPLQAPLSPSSSIRRGPSSKRLTPSSIPFFRRSSSQSMALPPSHSMPPPPSPTSGGLGSSSTRVRMYDSHSPVHDTSMTSPSVSTSHKKSSVLSLGLPSLLKGSSSRRSLHSDREKSDSKSARDTSTSKDSDRESKKKDDKDRSESRISVLMGRKRGKASLVGYLFAPYTDGSFRRSRLPSRSRRRRSLCLFRRCRCRPFLRRPHNELQV